MASLWTFAAFLFLIACVAWLFSVAVHAARPSNWPWRFSSMGLFVLLTVAAITAAMVKAVLCF